MLNVIYKVFARIMYDRIREKLGCSQSDEQFGFRASMSTTDTLFIFECMAEKCLEWGQPLVVASIDIKKAVGRIEHRALFDAVAEQGLPECYIHLLQNLYSEQHGVIGRKHRFAISRGVRQDDVLSPLLFSAALEVALSEWCQRQ